MKKICVRFFTIDFVIDRAELYKIYTYSKKEMMNEVDFMNKEEGKCMVDPKLGNFGTIQDDEINLYDLWKVIVKRK